MIEISPSAPYSNLLLWTRAEVKLWGPVKPIEKKIWNFDRIFLEEQGVHKKNGARFWVRMREIWSKQAQVLRIRTYSYELGLNWNFGGLISFSMMWKTRELAMMALQNELHTCITLDRKWTYTRLENRSSPKGGPWWCHKEKIGCMWHP